MQTRSAFTQQTTTPFLTTILAILTAPRQNRVMFISNYLCPSFARFGAKCLMSKIRNRLSGNLEVRQKIEMLSTQSIWKFSGDASGGPSKSICTSMENHECTQEAFCMNETPKHFGRKSMNVCRKHFLVGCLLGG